MKQKFDYRINYRTSEGRELSTIVTATSERLAKDVFYRTYAKTCEILKIEKK